MAFKQSFFLVLVLLASGVLLGKVEAEEAAETTNAVKTTASRKLLPIGAQIIEILGVGVDDGLEKRCPRRGQSCLKLGCCDGCLCVWPPYTCFGRC